MPRKPAGLPPHQHPPPPAARGAAAGAEGRGDGSPSGGLRPTSFRKGAASGGSPPRARRGEPDGCPSAGRGGRFNQSAGPAGPPHRPPRPGALWAPPSRGPAAPGLARGTRSRSVPVGRGARRGPRGARGAGRPAAAPVPSRRPEEARSGPAADTVWCEGPGTRDSDGTYIYVPTSLKIHIPYFELTNIAKLKW